MSGGNKLSAKFIDSLAMFSGKISSQKHILAIRDAFTALIPITIVASIFLLINNVLLNSKSGWLNFISGIDVYSGIGVQVYNGTLGIMALLAAFLIGNSLAKSYGLQGNTEGIIAVAAYVTLMPSVFKLTSIAGEQVEISGVLPQEMTSPTGMFMAIIASLISITLLGKISKNEKFKISMPDSVPPAISKSFNLILPALIILTLFGIISFATVHITGMTVPQIIVKVLQTPLIGGFQTLPGILLYVFLAGSLWAFGIHGAFVFGAISGPILLTSMQQNIEAVNAGQIMPNIVTQPFLDAYVYMGGGGTMIALVIAIFIASKREDHRMITKMGLVPSIFNISEPLLFGLPVAFNPIYGIPLVIAPLLSTTIGYLATKLGFVSATYISAPWITPPLISGYLATGGDIRASIVQLVIIAAATLIYLPFVLVANRNYIQEQKNQAMQSGDNI